MVTKLWIFLNNTKTRSVFYFHDVICTLWSNLTGKRCLSKVVQQAWKYLHIKFHEASLNGYRVMDFFCNNTERVFS